MKLLLQHGSVRPRSSIERLIEKRLFALAARQRLEEAVVRLHDEREASPRFQASVYLRVAGPDIHSTGSDHTLRGAVEKALAAAETQVASRQGRRVARRRREPLMAAGGLGW
ncbi:MAG: HPF/RaiA family ribosome-associated protein [Opitutaceae bacterium]|nr:HPF/RaiA family ribosome-associated protein [Opitutaceae bacterium]